MIGAQFCVRTFPVTGGRTHQPYAGRQIRSSLNYSSCCFSCSSFRFSFQLDHGKSRRSQILVSCNSSRSSGDKSNGTEQPDHEYAEAFVLLSETIRHYRMHMQGFQEEIKWSSSTQVFPSFLQARESRSDIGSVGPAFLRHFQSPTIFLKISCDGDFLLPILVGEFAVEKLIDSTSEDESWDCCPNQFQLVRNLAETLGYKVTMVKITERVVNTYFARILFCKPGEIDILSVDARPSDAINVAVRCRVPIYVRKQIVLTDGIRIGNGMGRKSIYDASLDSAADGPDIVAEELDLVMNMNLAVKEERYSDAATWKDKLIKLRESRRDL
ncbi:bifunctional nuclease 2 isoform X1 [Rhododendron vialii]|uniref:bifunctional nuclease 2 isoform X1 n=1 Tax=Rhododendron vialii TaxID=182163 RepID=UPI00265E5513|nr:bifunctional nuclease 2 isoform X1 [Rhododendron vialii]XP_058185190.1 bifunctional nuclease 2 isoform X1 [Rhododendron vialii]